MCTRNVTREYAKSIVFRSVGVVTRVLNEIYKKKKKKLNFSQYRK